MSQNVSQKKILPLSMNFVNLGDELWDNFRKRLSIKDKIDVLWVLVDFASNFSSYIKELVDKVPKLCNGIRLKLDSAKKEYIELKRQLKTLTKNRVKLHSNASMNRYGSDECKGKVNALKVKIAYLMEDIAFLEAKLIQSDIKRLEILGKDRNGNRYYWMDSNGSSSAISEKNEELYNCCFLWVQGPSEADINFCLDVDVESLKKWELLAKAKGTAYATKEVFSIFRSTDGSYYQTAQGENFMIINSNGILMKPTIPAFIDKKIISETPEKLLLSHHQWAFFNDIEDIHMLVDRLDDLRENEGQLKKALTSKMDRIEVSYKQQFKIKRRIECDETFKKNHKLLKNNEFTFPELKRIETTCTSNGQHFSNMEKIAKKLSRTKNDLVLEAILKDVAHLGECERALLKKQQNLIYPLNFHFEQLRTIDLEFIVETKRKRQEDILTKLLNHQRYKHISHVSGYGISSQRVDKAAHLDMQGILEEIECQLISRRREDEERN
ncbi:BEM_collapsed_G0055430.mRNA.1.CDS.1 [Saccharomyces cerevisiae]|nr:BEM_collapsed_G0055430.mRNA.1.CDS.1 [Saccharomyces cerevisiae]